MSSLSRLLPALPGFTALSHRPTPPTSPASPTAAARPPPSAAGPPPSATSHEPPTGSEAVKAVLRGIRRTIGSAKQGKAPATADLIGQMVALCPDSMIGRRDRALLCLGFAGAFRRSELCALAACRSEMRRDEASDCRSFVATACLWSVCGLSNGQKRLLDR